MKKIWNQWMKCFFLLLQNKWFISFFDASSKNDGCQLLSTVAWILFFSYVYWNSYWINIYIFGKYTLYYLKQLFKNTLDFDHNLKVTLKTNQSIFVYILTLKKSKIDKFPKIVRIIFCKLQVVDINIFINIFTSQFYPQILCAILTIGKFEMKSAEIEFILLLYRYVCFVLIWMNL